MPMLPSPLAAISYTAIKLVGYSVYSKALNEKLNQTVSIYKFGITKASLGLIGGISYLFLLHFLFGDERISDFALYVGLLPVRLIIWAFVVRFFYGPKIPFQKFILIITIGSIITYLLDGVMSIIYYSMPGMVTGFC